MLVLVSYDVPIEKKGQKRLRRVAKACENFGQRVQYSIFEGEGDRRSFSNPRAPSPVAINYCIKTY